MSARAAISIEEFWEKYADSDEGRFEYDDGQLIELPMPDPLHAAIVQRICLLMGLRYPQFLAGPELDCKVSAKKIRRPDISVERLAGIHSSYPEPDQPIHLAVEVLSPAQGRSVAKTFMDAVSKYREAYAPWGVPYCWILDAHTRTAWHSDNGFRQPVTLLEAGEIILQTVEIFEVLDKLEEAK